MELGHQTAIRGQSYLKAKEANTVFIHKLYVWLKAEKEEWKSKKSICIYIYI